MNRRIRTSATPLRRTLSALMILGALGVLGSLAACSGGSGKDDGQEQSQARLDELRQEKASLDQERQDLAAMKEKLQQAKAGDLEEGAEPVDQDALQAQIDAKNDDITTKAEKLNADLVGFINENPPIEGEPIAPTVQEAMHLKAKEDIILAKEYITEGGDYARAIQIYDDILAFDPDSQAAKDAKAEAEAMRYMDEERFAGVKKGMNRAKVRSVLGTVNLRNTRDYPEKGLIAWYYPKDGNGAAAAVYFHKKGDGYEVYKTDFNAIKDKSTQDTPPGS